MKSIFTPNNCLSIFNGLPFCISKKYYKSLVVLFCIVDQSNYGNHFILGFTQQIGSTLSGYNEITIIARFDATVTVTSLIMKDLDYVYTTPDWFENGVKK